VKLKGSLKSMTLRLRRNAMRVTAVYQNEILTKLLQLKKPMSLRELTHCSSLSYHQVASGILALKLKGYVRKVKVGVYEATENAKIEALSPEAQIKILKNKINELENLISSFLLRKKN
jgi:hypothetical protein